MTSRAERRRAAREANKHPLGRPPSEQRVQLVNPMADHYDSFIFGNALHCDRVVEQGMFRGKHIVICGAGPTLADHAEEWCPQGDEVWGVNSALTYLIDRGIRVTHGFTVDQQPQMCSEWATAPDVPYYLASTVHPHLTELLLAHGREIIWFHNYVGIRKPAVAYSVCNGCHAVAEYQAVECGTCGHNDLDSRILSYEDWLYATLYPSTCRTGSGLNSVNRAADLAIYGEAERVTILGADCALRIKSPPPEGAAMGSPEHMRWLDECVQMHADGGGALASGASALTLGGEIDGRWWESKPDMMISAVWLVKMQQRYGDRIQLIGDTLPNAIRDKTDEFLLRLPTMVDHEGKPIPIEFPDGHIESLANVTPPR